MNDEEKVGRESEPGWKKLELLKWEWERLGIWIGIGSHRRRESEKQRTVVLGCLSFGLLKRVVLVSPFFHLPTKQGIEEPSLSFLPLHVARIKIVFNSKKYYIIIFIWNGNKVY